MQVNVDDIVIKSNIETDMLRDIEETFICLREVNMKFNPKIEMLVRGGERKVPRNGGF